MPDSSDFISAEDFDFISDNGEHKSSIGRKNGEPVIGMQDEWTNTTNSLSGGANLIECATLADIWDFPVDNVFFDEQGGLWFSDPNIADVDSTGCDLDEGLISLARLSGDVDLLKEFDRINNFGKIFDIQFRDITHGQYKYANTRICNIVAQSLGFLSLDKLINDERVRQVRADKLNAEFADTDRADEFPPYSGFLVDPLYVEEGWINFDQVVHDRLESAQSYDEEASIAVRTRRFREAKRVLVQLAFTYQSNIPVLGSHNKITDFGVRMMDRTTGQQLTLSNFKNDKHTDFGDSAIATYTGRLVYLTETDIEGEVICNPCAKYKIIRCEGTIYREEECQTAEPADLGVSHEIAPQFRINPLIETRNTKQDILNTIDPIHWTGGTQDFTEEQWKGITKLREEFGEEALYSGRLNDSRAFHYAAGEFDAGFTTGGFAHEINEDNDLSYYGCRRTTEQWDGQDWTLLEDYELPVSRAAGLAGSDKGVFNIIAFGTRSVHEINGENGNVLTSFATPVPEFFQTNYQTSKTESMDSELNTPWTEAPCTVHTNVPRHSVAGLINASKSFITADGRALDAPTIDNCAGSDTTLSDIMKTDVDSEADIKINLPNDVFSTLSAFARDSAARAAGKGTVTNLKLVGPNYNQDASLIDSQRIPYTQDPSEQIPTPCFSQNTTGAMDFVIKKSDGTSDNYGDAAAEPAEGNPIGLPISTVCDAPSGSPLVFGDIASSVSSWEYPIVREDGSIVFVDTSNSVDSDLLREGQNANDGDWFEVYNASGIAFNGSTGGLILEDITDEELSDVFEYFHYVKFVQHTSQKTNATSYRPLTFTFENGSFCIDQNRKYPIKTVGTKYVGDETSGLATGGKTSNKIAGCLDDNASINIKYGYFGDERYDEFNNSIINIAYELQGDSWIRRDNLAENVAWHTGVGDESHAIFWGGLHASMESPDVSVSFPGCDDWRQAIESFGGTFNVRGNRGLDGEERFNFFSTRVDDDFENTYYKANDFRDVNELGVDYSEEWLEENPAQITEEWSKQIERTYSHVYYATYVQEDESLLVNYYVNGESWIGDLSASDVITDYEGFASGERTDTVGEWLKEFMDNDRFNEFFSSYRPDTDDNSLNGGNENVDASGIFPTRFNYFLNGYEPRTPVWKYSGHPVEGSMWIWSRPNPGEELFDPRSVHAEPTESGEWQPEEVWNKHSFQNHIGYEGFFAKWDQEYEDLVDDKTFATVTTSDQSKFVYWVTDYYDPMGQNTFSTLYEYDAEKIEKFYQNFTNYTDSCVAWQHFASQEAGRVRVRPEDTKYRVEYLTNPAWLPETGPLTITKSGSIDPSRNGPSTRRVNFVHRLPEGLNEAYTYDIDIKNNAPGIGVITIVEQGPNGFTIDIEDEFGEFEATYAPFTYTPITSGATGTYEGIGFVGTDLEACAESVVEGITGVGSIDWEINVDIRMDFLEMYHHGTNKNLNQQHGNPLSAIQQELRAYNENQNDLTFDFFTVEDMQFLLDYHVKLGNISPTKLAPPFITHVPEEGMSTPGSGSMFSVTAYETSLYQDTFTYPDSLPPFDQLVLSDHYPAAPITNQDWFLARYALGNFYDSDVNSVQRKILSYTKTDTENPYAYRYKDIVAPEIDSDTRRRLLAPETFKKFVTDFTPDLSYYNMEDFIHPRFINLYYPDSILSTGTGDVFEPILDETDENRWGIIPGDVVTIYNPNNPTQGKKLNGEIVVKQGSLCEIDINTLTTLTNLSSGNAFTDVNDLVTVTEDDYFFIINGEQVSLFGPDETDPLEFAYNYFRYNSANEVVGSPAAYAAAQGTYPCLTFPAGFDLDPEFRVYHSMFSTSKGGYFGAFVPSTGTVTNQGPLVYPAWMESGGLVWAGEGGNPGCIITPQDCSIFTMDTTRKIVFGDSNLIDQTFELPIDPSLGGGSEFITINSMYRNRNGIIAPDYARALAEDRDAPYVDLEGSRLQLYRTSKDLIDLLGKDNQVDILGGLFDTFWFNNATTFAPTDGTFINPEPRLRGYSTPAWDANQSFYENWNYNWNNDNFFGRLTQTVLISGGGNYTGDLIDVPGTYTQPFAFNVEFDAPLQTFLDNSTWGYQVYTNYQTSSADVTGANISGVGFNIPNWSPLVRETFTEDMSGNVTKSLVETCRAFQYDIVYQIRNEPNGTPVIDPFNQGSNKVIFSDQDENHERFRNQYDDNHWATGLGTKNFTVLADEIVYDNCTDDISFALNFGFERAFVDPLADVDGNNMTVAYDYYRYRFLNVEEDMENWMYVPYSTEVENNTLKLNNFATEVDTPEFMTYSFYMDRTCEGLDQFFYGQDNNQFVERWKFPHGQEVLNNLNVTKQLDGIDKLVTRSGSEYIDIQEYKPLQNGSLSVGTFNFPVISGEAIRFAGTENPLKEVIATIAELTCDGVDTTGAGFTELNKWLDSDNISGGPVNCYYPLSYDPYAGNSSLLPDLPYFKETNTNIRFDSTKVSSSIRDRAACWPWIDLLDGDPTNKPTQGNYTWHFTKGGEFWLAEVEYVGPRRTDPLGRTITNDIYDGSEQEESYRIRSYDKKANLVFDYRVIYQDNAGPQFIIEKNIGTDFSAFGTELKEKTIDLASFANRPINGPEMIDDINESEQVWQAIDWNYFSVNVDEFQYRYRRKELCDVIREGYNRGIVPDDGKMCTIKDISQVWLYSVPFSADNQGQPLEDLLWIEENPLTVSEYVTGSPFGFYDANNELQENIITVSTSGENTSGSPIGSQILYKRTYSRDDGNTGMRFSRSLFAGPTSRGIGLFNWGKSQAYGGELLHFGEREYVRSGSGLNTGQVIPNNDTLAQSWPWNVIGNFGESGARSFTDTVDLSGNYWFAFGDRDNLVELEQQVSNDVDFKQAYIIGMIAAENIPNFKASLMKSNIIRANDTLELFELGKLNPDYVEFSFLQAQIDGARLRDGIIEVVNSYEGENFFEIFAYLIDENVVNVDAAGFEEQKAIADADCDCDINALPVLPLPPLEIGDNPPEIIQDLVVVSQTDADCLICEVCDSVLTNYDSLENPTKWVQHNHDDWVAPFLESPFAGPYNSDGFNIWLTAGSNNPWGTQVWSRLEDGKVWCSYRRQRLQIAGDRDKLILMAITGTIAIESFADIQPEVVQISGGTEVLSGGQNVPVYCTYDEFHYNLEDYEDLDIVRFLREDECARRKYQFGIDCNDDFAVYNPILVNTEAISSCTIDPSGCMSEGISGNYICPDQTPNEVYTEWATGFIQEYKERQARSGTGGQQKYYFKYDVANTYDSNTFLAPESITEKDIVEYDWRRYQDGVGCGGDVPLLTVLDTDDFRCINLNECYIGQASFGTPDNAVVFGGYAVPADGQSGENIWWARFTAKGTFKWDTSVISPEDDLNRNYRHRTTSPFFSNGEQTLSRITNGLLMFDLGKEALVERQGVVQFNEQNEVEITFVDEIPDFFANNDKYSVVLQPDQNIKAWWSDKTPTGFTIKVELEQWTGSIDWQVVLVDSIPPEEVDGIGDNETFDQWDNL